MEKTFEICLTILLYGCEVRSISNEFINRKIFLEKSFEICLTIFLCGFRYVWQFSRMAMRRWICWQKSWQFYRMDFWQFYCMDIWQFSCEWNCQLSGSPIKLIMRFKREIHVTEGLGNKSFEYKYNTNIYSVRLVLKCFYVFIEEIILSNAGPLLWFQICGCWFTRLPEKISCFYQK